MMLSTTNCTGTVSGRAAGLTGTASSSLSSGTNWRIARAKAGSGRPALSTTEGRMTRTGRPLDRTSSSATALERVYSLWCSLPGRQPSSSEMQALATTPLT